MKKIMLAVVLLAVLAGISYLQLMRQDQKRTQTFSKGYSRGALEMEHQRSRSDSLADLLARQEGVLADSLKMRDKLFSAGMDSLSAIIDDQGKLLTDRQATDPPKEDETNKKTPNASQDRDENKGTVTARKLEHDSDGHHKVLAWYKGAIDKLPTDLTKYEERVAVQEVRSETAIKFNITMVRLDELRHDHKIRY